MSNIKRIGVKEYGPDDLRDVANLLWTNIGLKTSLSPLDHLMITSTTSEEDKTAICINLAAHLASLNKKVLLIDLDRQGSRFKKFLNYDTNLGFTDYCHRIFHEPFLSRSVQDYGFTDLMLLFYFKKRTGTLSLVSRDHTNVLLKILDGYPVDVTYKEDRTLYRHVMRSISELRHVPVPRIEEAIKKPQLNLNNPTYAEKIVLAGILTSPQLMTIFDTEISRLLKALRGKDFLFFEFMEGKNDEFAGLKKFCPAIPSFLKSDLLSEGHILSQLENFCLKTRHGFRFLPAGQFPLKGPHAAHQFNAILPILRQKFDMILINAPRLAGNEMSKALGKICDGTVLVVKNGAVEQRAFRDTLSEFRREKIKLLGAVMSDASPNDKSVI